MGNKTNLVNFFGGNTFVRILDVFIDNIGESLSKKQVQDLAGISRASLFNYWGKLEELNLIKETEHFINTRFYTLNRKSPLVKDLLRLEARMIEETLPKKATIAAR